MGIALVIVAWHVGILGVCRLSVRLLRVGRLSVRGVVRDIGVLLRVIGVLVGGI